MALDSIFYRGMLLGRTATVARWTLLKEFSSPRSNRSPGTDPGSGPKYLVANNRTVGVLVPIKSATAPTGRSKIGQEIR